MPAVIQVAYLEAVVTEVLTTLTINITLLSAVTPCSLAVKHRSLRRTLCSIIATEEYHEDGGSTLLLNDGICIPNYIESHSRSLLQLFKTCYAVSPPQTQQTTAPAFLSNRPINQCAEMKEL